MGSLHKFYSGLASKRHILLGNCLIFSSENTSNGAYVSAIPVRQDITYDDRALGGLFGNFAGGLGVGGESYKDEDGGKRGVSEQGVHLVILP